MCDPDIEALVAEAGRGYDLSELQPRPREPMVGVTIRMPESMVTRLLDRAVDENTSLSEVARAAIEKSLP